jgi:hypothetical protein
MNPLSFQVFSTDEPFEIGVEHDAMELVHLDLGVGEVVFQQYDFYEPQTTIQESSEKTFIRE